MYFINKSIVFLCVIFIYDGGGNSNVIVNMVKYMFQQYNGDFIKVFVIGIFFGGMMMVSYLLFELICVCLIMG